MHILLLLCSVTDTHSFALRESYNTFLKDNVDYKVDLIINDDDYEMINVNPLRNHIDEKEFEEFNKIVKIENSKIEKLKTESLSSNEDIEIPISSMILDIGTATSTEEQLTSHAIIKREITTEKEYNYDSLINEYLEQIYTEGESYDLSETPDYGVFASLKRMFLQDDNCKNDIGMLAVQCLTSNNSVGLPTKEIAARLWTVVQIWFLMYMIIAVPLWCTRGWCCCCLLCKFFKPHQTIKGAKQYLIANPPGVLKTKNGEVQYDPTDREKETYEEFDHFIKTL